jgi:hypothetical protein
LFTIVSEVERIEVEDVMNSKNFTQQAGLTSATLVAVEKAGDGYAVKVRLKTSNRDDSQLARSSMNGIKLYDTNGNEFDQNGWGGGGGGPEGYNYTVNFSRNRSSRNNDGLPVPAELTWEIPTKAIDTEVPFEFKDIPLP